MKEQASRMIIRHVIEKLEIEKKQQVMSCVGAIRDVMQSFDEENASLALMLVAAE